MKGFLSLLFVLAYCSALCQNGKLIQQTSFTLPDTSIRKMEKLAPDIKKSLAAVNFYHITYESDGLKVKGYLAVPKKAGKYPCIIYNRGGNREFGKITDEGFVERGLAELSSKDYVIVASQYRGNDGGEGKEEFGGKDVNDVLNLIPVLSGIPQADTARIGMFGWSRGGMMTYLALTKTSKIKAAVVGSGVTDLTKTLEERPEFDANVFTPLIPNYAANKLEALKERSAIYFAEKLSKITPILIMQGTADWRVSTSQVLEFIEKLYQIKQPFRFILYEGGDHALIEHRSDYIKQMTIWFDTYLRDSKPWPSLEPHGS